MVDIDPFDVSYEGRSGDYWDKSTCVVTSRGEWLLATTSQCVFGEPAVRTGTGTTATPIMKRTVISYPAAYSAGSGVLGVFIDYKRDLTGFTPAYYALLGSHHKNRDILIVLRGPVRIKNVGSGAILTTQAVIGADGGCEVATNLTTEYLLGRALQDIDAGKYGLVFVEPAYELET